MVLKLLVLKASRLFINRCKSAGSGPPLAPLPGLTNPVLSVSRVVPAASAPAMSSSGSGLI